MSAQYQKPKQASNENIFTLYPILIMNKRSNQIDLFLAVDKDGTESCCNVELIRRHDKPEWIDNCYEMCRVELPKGTIQILTGKNITWEDNPIRIKH